MADRAERTASIHFVERAARRDARNPASARVLGFGACEAVSGGAVGFGTFIWPSDYPRLSGYDYTPNANHWGIDIDGDEGQAVYATNASVIVYAGWNNYGYGNMIMVDHGNDFQSLYAHLSSINVVCGQSVGQGTLIGLIGSTWEFERASFAFRDPFGFFARQPVGLTAAPP
ncbi:MAG: M23 family metallopeptidase [Anaerolineales bacterium]